MDVFGTRRRSADVTVIGTGIAALSAALVLGDYHRRVVVTETPTWAPQGEIGATLSAAREVSPHPLETVARAKLAETPTTCVVRQAASDATRADDAFAVTLSDGSMVDSTFLLLAAEDAPPLPAKPGFATFVGRGVYRESDAAAKRHEHEPLAVYGHDRAALFAALRLRRWSGTVVLCPDGAPSWSEQDAEKLSRAGVRIYAQPVVGLEGSASDGLERVAFTDGSHLSCSAIFLASESAFTLSLAEQLGASCDELGFISSRAYAVEEVPGLFHLGRSRKVTHRASSAVFDGLEAGMAINVAINERTGFTQARALARRVKRLPV